MRDRFSKAWRAYGRARKKEDERQTRLTGAWVERAWEAILRVLTEAPTNSEEIPPLIAEQLRKDGLL